MNEIKWIEFRPGYEISNFGDCRRTSVSIIDKRGFKKTLGPKVLRRNYYSNGYQFYGIANKGRLVHRIVASAFIPNPDNKRCVNHIDGDKTNNCVDNLEWVTYSENHQHAYRTLGRISHWKGRSGVLHGKSKPVNKLDSDGNVINKFNSGREAAIHEGKALGAVNKAIREGYKINGYQFEHTGTRNYTK